MTDDLTIRSMCSDIYEGGDWEPMIDLIEQKDKEIEQLKRQIKIKNKYCQLIYDIGFDYDGYEKPNDLKMIIDELVSYSIDAINCDDKKVMYEDSNGKSSNILMEELDGMGNIISKNSEKVETTGTRD